MTGKPAEGRLLAGRYRLVTPLGGGGMGTVWRAHDEMLDRVVALKEFRIPSELSQQEQDLLRQRTMREARTAARLSHPNVVTVFDVLETDGRPWIVMEFVESDSLAHLVSARGPLPPRRVAEIGLQVLAALRAAHALGVLHRDVKPANVLLTADGRAVLTDFGIATVEGDTSLTMSGTLVGSPGYIAPERARGLGAGPKSDLWSLGATLYTAVEGRPPYNRSGPLPILAAVITEEPDPPQRAGPLWPVLRELLLKDPDERIDAAQTRSFLRDVAYAAPGEAPSAAPGRAQAADAQGAPPGGPSPARPGRPASDGSATASGPGGSPTAASAPRWSAASALAASRRRVAERTRVLPWLTPGPPAEGGAAGTMVATPVRPAHRRLALASSAAALLVAASVLVGWGLLEAGNGSSAERRTAEPRVTPTLSPTPRPSPTPTRATVQAPVKAQVGPKPAARPNDRGGNGNTGSDTKGKGRGKGKDKKRR